MELILESTNKRQVTSNILMIRPAHFGYNEETAANNAFQVAETNLSAAEIQQKAIAQFDAFVEKLRNHGILVHVIEDTDDPAKPDAVFPNNWISFHENGDIITYPMFSAKRRNERREDIIEKITDRFEVNRRYSFEHYEEDQLFLEGTGSMVFDRPNKILYACLSERTNILLLDKFCVLSGYKKVVFHATDREGTNIYHTNVMMSLGKSLCVICLESIKDGEEKDEVLHSLNASEKEILEISYPQMEAFAGNMLQVENQDGEQFMIMSSQAFESLSEGQQKAIEKHAKILHSSLHILEQFGGGSARCMMAEIFLSPKKIVD